MPKRCLLKFIYENANALVFVLFTLLKKKKLSIKDLFSKFDQIHRNLRICSHLREKSLMEDFIKYYVFKGIKESNKTCKVVGQTGELRSKEGKGRNIVWFEMNLRFIVQDPFCLLSVDLKCYSISSGAIFSTSKRMSNLQALFYNFGKTRYPWLRSIKQRQKH